MTMQVTWPLRCCFVLLFAGCGSETGDHSRFVPSESTARQSLEAALSAWQRGDSVGSLASMDPAVSVVDTKRPSGQKLIRFEILSEASGAGPRWFSVRLEFEPKGECQARYAVVGQDPIWVFRDADYAQAESM